MSHATSRCDVLRGDSVPQQNESPARFFTLWITCLPDILKRGGHWALEVAVVPLAASGGALSLAVGKTGPATEAAKKKTPAAGARVKTCVRRLLSSGKS
jgi:hypothetical protein